MSRNDERLVYLGDEDRLKMYQSIVSGCQHMWSKGKLQEHIMKNVLDQMIDLAQKDPYFMAHFTSYIIKHSDSKDLKVLATFANSLNDADGTPFKIGGKIKKPNLRLISQAAIQNLDPKLVYRVVMLATKKMGFNEKYAEASHYSRSLKTAIKKYLKYREANPKAIEGIRKAGLSKTFQKIYRMSHIAPSMEAAAMLGWKQKKGEPIKKVQLYNFDGLSPIDIAKKIRDEKLAPTGVLGALKNKISPVVAGAILEQCSGNQAVILRELFDSQGLFKNKDVVEVFQKKISEATTALDRVNRINTEVDEDIKKVLKSAKAAKRKEQASGIGSVFIHIDISASMSSALEVAKQKAAIIAECVDNPKENFHWGVFNQHGRKLKNPEQFEQEYFEAVLYGIRDNGSTDCIALYKTARDLGATVDFYITDGSHNQGSITERIRKMDAAGVPRPESIVIVKVGGYSPRFYNELTHLGIPTVEVNPQALTESALVAQTVREAAKGHLALIEQIMETPLLKLPQWWATV